MINPLVSIDVSLYFKIANSHMYGGPGSIGYASARYGEVGNILELNEDWIHTVIRDLAATLGIQPHDIVLISKAEYEEATSEEDDDEDYYDE